MKKRITAAISLILIVSILLITIPQTIPQPAISRSDNAQFVLASWDFPDEYGQGIYGFQFYENSTGSWVAAPWYYVGGELDGLPYYFLHSYDPYTLNWSAGVAMKLRVHTILNTTLTGAIDEADGQNYLRHSVTVTSVGNITFSQQNFTYYDVTPWEDIPLYEYDVILNFLPVVGAIYTVTVTYEVYF